MKKFLVTAACLMVWQLPSALHAADVDAYLENIPDKEFIKVTASIYNTYPRTWEDEVARNVALGKLTGMAKGRRSPEIEGSGIMEYRYEKVALKTWPEETLRDLYGLLRKRHRGINWRVFPFLISREKAFRLMREITIEEIYRLIRPESRPVKRQHFKGSWWM